MMKASETRKSERDRQHIRDGELETMQWENQQEINEMVKGWGKDMSLTSKQLEEYVLRDGLSELDLQTLQLKRWLQEKRYSQAYVTVGDLIKLLHGLRRPIKNLEGKSK